MKAVRVSPNQVLLTLTPASITAIQRARREVRKDSIAKDMGERKNSLVVRRVNFLPMLIGRLFDDARPTSEVRTEAIDI